MSEAQKPTETPAAVPAVEEPTTTTTPAVTETETAPETPAKDVPAATTTTEEEPAKDAPAEGATEETAKEEAKVEVTPATDGVLGYKAPGLVKGFRFAKRHFWFSDDATELKHLAAYFQNEKLSLAHPTAAWATQTGKGLLFFAKRAEDKATPTGIINLAEITEVIKEGSNEFLFKWNGQKHTFQAANTAERDSWIAAVEAQTAAGKAEKETIVGSDGYKAELEKLTKPATPVVAAKKPAEDKAKEPETKDKPEAETAAPEPKAKSRSQSRKRASIFGNFLVKKDEAEEKKEEKVEEEADKKPETEAPAAAESSAAAETAAPAETTPAVTETPAAEETKPEEKTEAPATSNKAKRSSIFGSLFNKVANQDKEKAEKEAPAAKASETPAVSSTAPQLGDPVDASASEPIKPESVTAPSTEQPKTEGDKSTASPSSKFLSFVKKEIKLDDKKEAKPEEKADKPAEQKPEETPKEEAVTTPTESTATPGNLKDRRRTSFFGSLGTKKEKKVVETAEGEAAEGEAKAKSPVSSKLGGLFRKPSKAVKKETEAAAAPAAPENEPIAEGTEQTETAAATETPAATETAANGDATADKTEDAPAAAPETAAASEPVKATA